MTNRRMHASITAPRTRRSRYPGAAFAFVAASFACAASSGCSKEQPACTDCTKKPVLVPIDGDVMPFLSEVDGPRVAGATISIVEHPGMTTTSDAGGHFHFDGI